MLHLLLSREPVVDVVFWSRGLPVQLRSWSHAILGLFLHDLRAIPTLSHVSGLALHHLLGRVIRTHGVAVIATTVQAIHINSRATGPSELGNVLCILILARPAFVIFLVQDLEAVVGLAGQL